MRKTLSILALLLLVSSLMLSTLPLAKAQGDQAKWTIDGRDTEWVGIAPTTPNTWAISRGEFIWVDEVGDDTGNGTYTYPIANVSGTQKRAFNPGDFDLKQLRIQWNDTGVAFLMKFVNITDDDWVGSNTPWPSYWLSNPIEAETTAIAICIDTDRADGSGYDMVDDGADGISADIWLPSTAYWEYLIEIVLGDIVLWRYDTSTMAPVEATRNFPCAADNTSAYESVEFMVPIDIAGGGINGLPDPTGQTWRFSVFIGSQDREFFREVWASPGTPEWQGGGGADHDFDPDAYDAAFFASKTEQEIAFNGFTDTEYAIVSAYKDINMDPIYVPEFPLPLPIGFAIMAAVILAALFKMRKKLYL